AGNALDQGTVTFTPAAGQNNPVGVTLNGIPYTIAVGGVPAKFNAGTAAQSAPLAVTVADHFGETISGTYANPVRIADPDAAPNGTTLTGTHVGSGCAGSCVDLQGDGDAIALDYG